MLSLKLPRLLTIHQVPKVFREQGILFGYRHPKSSATDCIFSVFQMTNETVNIWTHLLPSGYFLWKLFVLLYAWDVWNDPYTWPFLTYMVTCCLYPLASSFAHTFSTMSGQARHICYFFDYGALALYSLGSAIAYSAYIFPEEWLNSTLHRGFIFVAVLNTVLSMSLSCYSRFTEAERSKFTKVIRTLAFVYPYLFDSLPLFYRLYLCASRGCSEHVIPVHYRHIAFAFFTCFVYATHLPERLVPGLFDFIGHSHQLFHICGVTGTHFQMEALLIDMTDRRAQLLAASPMPSFSQTVSPLVASLTISLFIIAAFSMTLYSMPKFSRRENKHRD